MSSFATPLRVAWSGVRRSSPKWPATSSPRTPRVPDSGDEGHDSPERARGLASGPAPQPAATHLPPSSGDELSLSLAESLALPRPDPLPGGISSRRHDRVGHPRESARPPPIRRPARRRRAWDRREKGEATPGAHTADGFRRPGGPRPARSRSPDSARRSAHHAEVIGRPDGIPARRDRGTFAAGRDDTIRFLVRRRLLGHRPGRGACPEARGSTRRSTRRTRMRTCRLVGPRGP